MFDEMEKSGQRGSMEIIEELMEELKCAMEPGEEDFNERLGRKKPDAVAIEIESKGEEPMEDEEYAMDDMMEESPEDKLKSRLLKLRG